MFAKRSSLTESKKGRRVKSPQQEVFHGERGYCSA
ncbi:MAG: hypothetical protein UW63_C0083G0005, partial [Candidatus Uhrbacteria bacterium GW2011_GWF2_44_350]